MGLVEFFQLFCMSLIAVALLGAVVYFLIYLFRR